MINIEKSGQGFPIVFLHGYCESVDVWKDFTTELAADYQVVLVDLPGFGKSPLPQRDFSLYEVAGQVGGALEGQGITEYLVVGHSLGGYVGLAMAHQFQDKVKGLCLFHSSAQPDSEEKQANRNKAIAFVEENGMPPFLKTFVPSLFNQDKWDENQQAIRQMHQIAAHTSVDTFVAYAKAMRDRPGYEDFLLSWNKPTLLIAGDKDNAVPLTKSQEQIDKGLFTDYIIIKNIAHMGMYEDKPATLSKLKAFIADCV